MNNRPYELAVNKKGGSCRSDWYAHDHEAACGFAHDPQGRRIFDSQVSMHAEPVWHHRQFKSALFSWASASQIQHSRACSLCRVSVAIVT